MKMKERQGLILIFLISVKTAKQERIDKTMVTN